MRKPVKKSRQLGGDLDKGGGSGDGAQQVDWSHGLNSEALVTILKYRSIISPEIITCVLDFFVSFIF